MAAYEYWRVQVQFTSGVWTEVTSDVDGPIRATNGATPETTGEPASMSLVLHNPGFKYTPGNTTSATALATGLPIRFFEVISDQYIYHFTGSVEMPEIGSVNLSMTQTQAIAVNAIDQLSAWGRSKTFPSTVGAHIIGSGGTALKDYWPFNDQQGPAFVNVLGGSNMVATTTRAAITYAGEPALRAQLGASLPGDDVVPLRIVPATTGTVTSAYMGMQALFSIPLAQRSLAAGQTLTIVAWANLDLTLDEEVCPIAVTTTDGPIVLSRRATGDAFAPLAWRLTKPVGTLTGSVNSTLLVGSSRYYMLGLRFGFTPNVIELWVDGDVYTGTLSGAFAGPAIISSVFFGQNFLGSIAHMQMYIGAAADWDRTAFLAQRTVGLLGLGRQTTGDRIKTLARYAGKTDGQLVNVDNGCSIMQAARLAGKTVAQGMYEARDTEQGDLFIDGSGLLTFHDRRTILNI